MFGRLIDAAIATFLVVLVFSTGWLEIPKDRVGAIACLVIAVAGLAWAFRPRRRRQSS